MEEVDGPAGRFVQDLLVNRTGVSFRPRQPSLPGAGQCCGGGCPQGGEVGWDKIFQRCVPVGDRVVVGSGNQDQSAAGFPDKIPQVLLGALAEESRVDVSKNHHVEFKQFVPVDREILAGGWCVFD